MRVRSNRGSLPNPDALGRWRPEVGRDLKGKRVRFQVGNKRDTSEAEAVRRLNAIRDLYDRQCAELHLTHSAPSVQGWALKLAQGVPVVVKASPMARGNPGQAAEELGLVRQLQSWGVPITIADDLPILGYAHIQLRIEEEVQRAVAAAVATVKQGWGGDFVEEAIQQSALPADPAAAPRGTLHKAIEAYKTHLQQTGKHDGQGNLSPHYRKCLERLDMLREHHADCHLWKLDYGKIEAMVSYWRNRPPTKRGGQCSTSTPPRCSSSYSATCGGSTGSRSTDGRCHAGWSRSSGPPIRYVKTTGTTRRPSTARPRKFTRQSNWHLLLVTPMTSAAQWLAFA